MRVCIPKPASLVKPAESAPQLRKCDSDRRTPIVVLHERQPDEATWGALQALGPTLFCKGEPSDGTSLAASRATHARALVYLAHPQRPMKVRLAGAWLTVCFARLAKPVLPRAGGRRRDHGGQQLCIARCCAGGRAGLRRCWLALLVWAASCVHMCGAAHVICMDGCK